MQAGERQSFLPYTADADQHWMETRGGKEGDLTVTHCHSISSVAWQTWTCICPWSVGAVCVAMARRDRPRAFIDICQVEERSLVLRKTRHGYIGNSSERNDLTFGILEGELFVSILFLNYPCTKDAINSRGGKKEIWRRNRNKKITSKDTHSNKIFWEREGWQNGFAAKSANNIIIWMEGKKWLVWDGDQEEKKDWLELKTCGNGIKPAHLAESWQPAIRQLFCIWNKNKSWSEKGERSTGIFLEIAWNQW